MMQEHTNVQSRHISDAYGQLGDAIKKEAAPNASNDNSHRPGIAA
jgi:hypothetical protein